MHGFTAAHHQPFLHLPSQAHCAPFPSFPPPPPPQADAMHGSTKYYQQLLADAMHGFTAVHSQAPFHLVAMFGPEHGFRGTAQAGKSESASKDPRTGLPIFDLYGKTRGAGKSESASKDPKTGLPIFDLYGKVRSRGGRGEARRREMEGGASEVRRRGGRAEGIGRWGLRVGGRWGAEGGAEGKQDETQKVRERRGAGGEQVRERRGAGGEQVRERRGAGGEQVRERRGAGGEQVRERRGAGGEQVRERRGAGGEQVRERRGAGGEQVRRTRWGTGEGQRGGAEQIDCRPARDPPSIAKCFEASGADTIVFDIQDVGVSAVRSRGGCCEHTKLASTRSSGSSMAASSQLLSLLLSAVSSCLTPHPPSMWPPLPQARFYTFIWELYGCLVAAALSPSIRRFLVLDTPPPVHVAPPPPGSLLHARFYTFIWTLYDCLVAAALCPSIRRFLVLDRPNPLGGMVVDGPITEPQHASFVGRKAIPLRHGMTVGELSLLFFSDQQQNISREAPPLSSISPPATVSALLSSATAAEATAPSATVPTALQLLLWVPPSPNMPTPTTALVYAGTCLIEHARTTPTTALVYTGTCLIEVWSCVGVCFETSQN
ncbi:unnamed protein product [Closterium sp. Naga37s-1]|nr:unnamed protein product [Closterium sp. Naga37s-1]